MAGLLAWIVPGLGHLFIGERARGLAILITISVTFWGGVAIGSVRDTVHPQIRKAWFMAQICTGSHALISYKWGQAVRSVPASPDDDTLAYWKSVETAVVYTGVAGLLNLLAILDAITRADPASQRVLATTRAARTRGAR